jgi:hypothetical protein
VQGQKLEFRIRWAKINRESVGARVNRCHRKAEYFVFRGHKLNFHIGAFRPGRKFLCPSKTS